MLPLRDRTRDRSTSAPAHRPRPIRLPLSPGTPDNPRDREGPRFMCRAQAEKIQKVEYRPRPKYTGPKYPTIMGATPNRLKPKPKPVEVKKHETRRTRILKTLRNPDRMKMRWKGTAKSLMRMRMLKRLNGCLKALHSNAVNPASAVLADIPEERPLEIEVSCLCFCGIVGRLTVCRIVQADLSPEGDQAGVYATWSSQT